MDDENFVLCTGCKKYLPIHHPQASEWSAGHGTCNEWGHTGEHADKVRTALGEEHEAVVLSWKLPARSVLYVEEVPEGYEPVVAAIEELAFTNPPDATGLT